MSNPEHDNRNAMRVHELAKQRRMPANDLIAVLKEYHMDVGSHMKMLTAGQLKEAMFILDTHEKKARPEIAEEMKKAVEKSKPAPKKQYPNNYVVGGLKKDEGYLVLTYEINPDTLEATLVDTIEESTRARALLKAKELFMTRGVIK
jgi:TPP-dependent indolepyruvate ferredoxin oxidoreductase alpha subunit